MPSPIASPGRDSDRYRDTIEATLPAGQFSAEALRRRLEATTAEGTPLAGPLDRTGADLPPAPGAPPLLESPSLGAKAPARFAHTVPPGPRYELHELLGAGASGEVYRATDLNLGREVAVKLLRSVPKAARDRDDRFVHEARVTAQLEHPSILPSMTST